MTKIENIGKDSKCTLLPLLHLSRVQEYSFCTLLMVAAAESAELSHVSAAAGDVRQFIIHSGGQQRGVVTLSVHLTMANQ